MGKHTPGPWATYRDQLSVGETRGHSGICEVWERHGGDGFENARLIAAAPDLLEALEAADTQIRIAYECVEAGRHDEALLHLGSMSRQRAEAIAKAKGEPTN